MCDCNCERPDFFSEKIVRARKQRQCNECGLLILPGQIYRKTAGKWQGDFMFFATCQPCIVLWRSVEILEGTCLCYGALHEEVAELERRFE